ncbi:MAG: YfiT family bacillithiol transferase [Bryobacteraceae bacterium]
MGLDRYPIGPFLYEEPFTPSLRATALDEIEQTPANLRAAAAGLTEEQLDTPYREGGWTVRQVVHHLPDSHVNSYVRFKLAMTESDPVIRPYDEVLWAELPDSKAPIELSLDLLDAVHRRWTVLLRSFSTSDFARTYRHPEIGRVTLDWAVASYSWHGRHHVAHIASLRQRLGW